MRWNRFFAHSRGALPPVLITLLLAGCGQGDTGGDPPAAAELPGAAITLWTDSTELFMEHPALIVGRAEKFAVHLTDLTDFAPIRAGRIVLRFEPAEGGEGFTVVQEAPRSPGIYGPAPQFPRAGLWNLSISVESPQARDVITVPGLPVYSAEADVPAATEAGSGAVPFLKEQQWKTEGFRTGFVADGTVLESFDATGTVIPAAGHVAEVAAPIAGLLDAEGLANAPVVGQRVTKGQVLATLTPALGDGGNAYAEARGALRQAQEEYARMERLHAVEAIPTRRLHEARNRLQVSQEALAGLNAGATPADGRLSLRAPISGIIAARAASPGASVEAGHRLFTIVDPSVVWLKADVPAAQAARVSPASGAVFQLEGAKRMYQARRTISVGSMLDSASRTLPVIYEVANPDGAIKIGTNARIGVRTGQRLKGMVIPISAVLDEDGRPIAYVEVDGEHFEKRELTIGGRDGERVVILGGLNPGERVVTGAAYQVRLASLSTAVPAHGHEH
ncbi:MAG: efflux RND transporter periplasmic adaptor subunit [Gemmatimonadota bacterium]|nr:efflux RND transporter periplasmic adaptor subunit [Gemmatimonadota bacterium]